MQLVKLVGFFIFISISIHSQNISLRNQNNQYDFVIITLDEFVPICEQFAEHKSNSKNIKTLVTTKGEILSEFSDSTLLQDNIREFISFAGSNWAEPQPKYFMFAADVDSIPNFSFEVFPNTEYYSIANSDYFYGKNIFDEDTTKLSFSVGRIAARTEDELTKYFGKVINYEDDSFVNDWNNNSLYLADDGATDNNPTRNSLFEATAFRVSERTPDYISKKYFFQSDSSEYFGTTDLIVNYINNNGVSSIFFCGYGNDTIYTHEAFFSSSDVDRLSNLNEPFFVSLTYSHSFSCRNNDSMLDKMLFSTGGALVGIAPVGVVYAHSNSVMSNLIWSKLYTGLSVGEILKETLGGHFILEERKYNLFGDPTIVLKYDPFADVDSNPTGLPTEFTLSQNYPNPFNPTTKIAYSIPSNGLNVNLSVYNILGQEVVVLVNSVQNMGNYEVEFNASKLSSGVYLYRLSAGSFVKTSKMILLR